MTIISKKFSDFSYNTGSPFYLYHNTIFIVVGNALVYSQTDNIHHDKLMKIEPFSKSYRWDSMKILNNGIRITRNSTDIEHISFKTAVDEEDKKNYLNLIAQVNSLNPVDDGIVLNKKDIDLAHKIGSCLQYYIRDMLIEQKRSEQGQMFTTMYNHYSKFTILLTNGVNLI